LDHITRTKRGINLKNKDMAKNDDLIDKFTRLV